MLTNGSLSAATLPRRSSQLTRTPLDIGLAFSNPREANKRLIATLANSKIRLTCGKQKLLQISNRNKNGVSDFHKVYSSLQLRTPILGVRCAPPESRNRTPSLQILIVSQKRLEFAATPSKQRAVVLSNRLKIRRFFRPLSPPQQWPRCAARARIERRLLLLKALQRHTLGLQGSASSPFHLAGTQ
jgi:hypothetical protein